jgi:hypothetical protein
VASAKGRFNITNTSGADLRVIVEPWADEAVVAAGKTLKIAFQGPPADLEIEVEPGILTVYGWPGSVLEIEEN